MSANLSKYILTTLAYYDALDYPMTAFEVWKYLTRAGEDGAQDKIEIAAVLKELESDKLKNFIKESQGFYFLKGRESLVPQRLERYKIAERKLRIARRAVKFLRFVPFVRMIAVTGRLAMKNTEKKSDLDFLVVLKNGKIFTGRLLVTLVIHLFGQRRYGTKIENRICLNHFFNKNRLEADLKDFFSASEYFFSASEYFFMFPLFGPKTWRRFRAKNGWIEKYKVNYSFHESSPLKIVKDNAFSKIIRKLGEKLLQWRLIEKKLKAWQTERIARDPRTHQDGSVIIANDRRLIFLPKPQGAEIYAKFEKNLERLAMLG